MLYCIKSESELYHHGILGMEWGKRNGPPYPLSAGDHSAKEKRADYKKSIKGNGTSKSKSSSSSGSESTGTKKKGLTETQKRALAVGATIAAECLIAYGGYKIATNPKLRGRIYKGVLAVDKMRSKTKFSGIKNDIPVVDRTFSKQISKVGSANTFNHDCVPGSMALLASVNEGKALKAKDLKHGLDWGDVKKVYEGAKEQRVMPIDTPGELGNYIAKKFGDDGNGLVGLRSPSDWNHMIAAEVKGDSVIFHDQQFSFGGLKGVSFSSDGKSLVVGGKEMNDVAGAFLERYFSKYDMDQTDICKIDHLKVTDDMSVINEYFDIRK